MKKYLLLGSLFLLLACDDGDLQIETVDFDSIDEIELCDEITVNVENVVFKINDDEALILTLASSLIQNSATTTDRESAVPGSSQVTYRIFSETVTSSYFCDSPPPITPTVSEEIEAEGGDVEVAQSTAERVTEMMEENFPGVRIDSVDSVSGKVSDELYSAGAWALGLAMLAISIYIWIRFEWQFGVGALFALFHDVALTFGFFALTQMEFNLNIVAAILTIIGYSLNDTIVVYDRIRENLRKYRKMEIIALLDL